MKEYGPISACRLAQQWPCGLPGLSLARWPRPDSLAACPGAGSSTSQGGGWRGGPATPVLPAARR
jgi:hypothetical protein